MLMNVVKSLREKLMGLIEAINRYPLTMFFLLATATVNMNMINNEVENYSKYLFTFVIGALLSIVAQQTFERFFTRISERIMLMGASVALTAGYFFAIRSASTFNMEMGTKTGVTIFALMMVFILVPSIKSVITFNQSFMSVFKAFFITALFTAVISIGLSSILLAVDQLLFSLDYKAYEHVLNIVFSLFAPIFFLSFTPSYPGKRDASGIKGEQGLQMDQVAKAVDTPKLLGILISYIIIPLTAIYTVILLAYVVLNISGDFWTNNLLEPMLVSYAITVILVYILASNLENQFAVLFRKIFPKVLIPIVLFQTIASILRIGEMGITYGRYYVILFGIFAVIAGVIFSFFPIRKNGLIAAVLIVFSAISIIPPIDAFTISRENQMNLLKSTLSENGMLENGEIVPNADISTKDKKTITRTVSYLDSMDYIDGIDWLPDKVFHYGNFKNTFGFEETYDETDVGKNDNQSAYLDWERSPSLNIENYDRMVNLYVNGYQKTKDVGTVIPLKIDNKNYKLKNLVDEENIFLILVDESDQELIRFDAKKAFERIFDNQKELKGENLSVKEATVTEENDAVRMSIVTNNVDYYNSRYDADLYVFIQIK
ncbi:DUF4153 domain-containing protein [Siminovitchia terrae]|uniref:DUF4153 domain-containing protein n=2 Tax=Siminovitchia terrae TaxID=1914933 RepID=A0A429X931_SIMTE|nr:DUF4153 domain-containing protein [Siminovitchia terrae]